MEGSNMNAEATVDGSSTTESSSKAARPPREERIQKLLDKALYAGGSPVAQEIRNFLNGTWLDHYESVLRILDDLAKLLYPKGSGVPTDNPEGKMLMRILFSSCADTFETFMSDLLYEIYLAKPQTLKSEATVTVKEVLDCSDMQEFITRYAKEKLTKLQRGSVKGFIADNKAIKSLNVFDATRIEEIEKILQIRHLYTHQNGIIDEKFRKSFPLTKVNDEYRMTLDEFLDRFDYLAQAIEAVDEAARKDFKLAAFS